ncbi:restriction endonuclease subunit S [Vibrio cholerae]|uniref:restriction endonuclease subunit S n=1 Tax=Vibrio cholerae TaxID=666 RepID=UPI000E0A19A1|nr:restriction endonuclease subunit S [Vibrio cholerae]
MSQLPKGWVNLALGDLCSKLTDGSHNPPKAKESGLPMLSAKNIQNGKLHFGLGSRLISEDEFIVEDKRTRISQGDVLLTIVGALGRAAVVTTPEKFTLQRSVAVLHAPLVSPFFLKYSFESPAFQKQVFDNAKGTAQKGIYLKKLRELSISLPSAAEQTRIVEKLDEVLAQVDTIKARLDGIPEILKRFRQSVLAAAVSGKLTEELRFERLEHSEHKLKEILDITSGIAFKKSQYSEEGSRLLQIANVSYGKAKWDKESFVSLELAKEYKDYGLIEGDLVMALNRPITNGMLKVAQIVRNDLPATLYQRVARLRVKEAVKTTLATEYLFLSLRSSEFREQVEQNLKGSDQPYLNTSTLGELNISIYLLEEQKEIVRLVDQYFAFADTIEAQVKKAQARVDKLTQSILAKAFRGELVPQDPNDEPADKLLERIALARKEAEVLAKAAKKAAKK